MNWFDNSEIDGSENILYPLVILAGYIYPGAVLSERVSCVFVCFVKGLIHHHRHANRYTKAGENSVHIHNNASAITTNNNKRTRFADKSLQKGAKFLARDCEIVESTGAAKEKDGFPPGFSFPRLDFILFAGKILEVEGWRNVTTTTTTRTPNNLVGL